MAERARVNEGERQLPALASRTTELDAPNSGQAFASHSRSRPRVVSEIAAMQYNGTPFVPAEGVRTNLALNY